MPVIHVGAVVLVTGASGFIGTHVVRALDQAGFWVRAAVRSADKGEYLKTLVSGIQIVVVPDMTAVSRWVVELICHPCVQRSHLLPSFLPYPPSLLLPFLASTLPTLTPRPPSL